MDFLRRHWRIMLAGTLLATIPLIGGWLISVSYYYFRWSDLPRYCAIMLIAGLISLRLRR